MICLFRRDVYSKFPQAGGCSDNAVRTSLTSRDLSLVVAVFLRYPFRLVLSSNLSRVLSVLSFSSLSSQLGQVYPRGLFGKASFRVQSVSQSVMEDLLRKGLEIAENRRGASSEVIDNGPMFWFLATLLVRDVSG